MKQIRSPFKFLDAFTLADRREFFGRDTEIEQLYDLVFKTPLLLIYGASGTGKTSLIQCGLASKFDGTDWLPLWIRRDVDINRAMQLAINRVLPHKETNENTPNTEGSIPDNIQRLYQHYLRPVFLIFDQFEELFIFGTQEERQLFVEQIKSLLDKELPCTILIVIREEYLGHLYPFEKEIPELFDFRLRVEPMDAVHVKEVLDNSFQTFNIAVEPPKEDRYAQIIDNVSRAKSGIELPYLQVYLDMLYREDFERTYPNADNAQTQLETTQGWRPLEFTQAEITEFGTIDNVLDKFIDEQQMRIQEQIQQRAPSLRTDTVRQILDAFVSYEGTKRPIPYTRDQERVVLAQTERDFFPQIDDNLLDFCLKAMESARLIRLNDTHTELAHDSLAALIDKRRTDEQRLRNDIKRQIKSMHQNFSRTSEYLTQKQINVFEDVLDDLNLEGELMRFFEESKGVRGNETAVELERERVRNVELEKAIKETKYMKFKVEGTNKELERRIQEARMMRLEAEKARDEAQKQKHFAQRARYEAEKSATIAKDFALKTDSARIRAITFAAIASLGFIIAIWFYFDSRKQRNMAIEEKNKAEKSLKDMLKAQQDKEMVEFKIVLNKIKQVLQGGNCPTPEQLQKMKEMKIKYLTDADLQGQINGIPLGNCR